MLYSPSYFFMQDDIKVVGARTHNLKNISVSIPRGTLSVITGISGSGKSSLAFDTIYAEGQQRYVESLSSYARQFLGMMQRPEVDSITGLSPAISIDQKTVSRNPRSTVGTVTEIYDYLRLLFARVGTPISPATGKPIEKQSASSIVDTLLKEKEGTKLMIIAPLFENKKGSFSAEIARIKKDGFIRYLLDGELLTINDEPDIDPKKKHSLAVVVDRVVINKEDDTRKRIADSVELAVQKSDGRIITRNAETHEEAVHSTVFACPVSGFSLPELTPQMFSFNSPHGACKTCHGLGVEVVVDENAVIPKPRLSIEEGELLPLGRP